jgi:hypothetical protein
MAACRSSSESTGKMSLLPIFNKNSPRAHTESELDVLGIHGKLVKYVVHSSKRKNWEKFIFLHTSCQNSKRPVFGLKEFYGLAYNVKFEYKKMHDNKDMHEGKLQTTIVLD